MTKIVKKAIRHGNILTKYHLDAVPEALISEWVMVMKWLRRNNFDEDIVSSEWAVIKWC